MPSKSKKGKTPIYKLDQIERVRVPNFCSVYANNTNGSATFYDLSLLFGQAVGAPSKDKPYIEDRVSVTLAWEHVGPLRDLIDRLLKGHEEAYGPIRKQPQPPAKKKK